MNNNRKRIQPRRPLRPLMLAALILLAAGCKSGELTVSHTNEPAGRQSNDSKLLVLPPLRPADLHPGERIRILATTTVLGDVIAQVGGDAVELTILMRPGQDPHGYEPSARDLTAVAEAHAIFVNGWNLEQSLAADIMDVAGDVPILPASAGIQPRSSGKTADPHVWLNPHHVMKWVENMTQALAALDPAHEAEYRQNASAYQVQLNQLIDYAAERIATIPVEKRILVTNHDSLGYFADQYGFTIVGTVIPAADTLAEPSAQALSRLVDQMAAAGICTIYAETSASDRLAQATASELDGCPTVQILKLYTGALGAPGSEADSYLNMMRTNIDTIVAGQAHE
jgi:ABC-type Zn uptake system ZnuABC Zn-binding protein ZnuA